MALDGLLEQADNEYLAGLPAVRTPSTKAHDADANFSLPWIAVEPTEPADLEFLTSLMHLSSSTGIATTFVSPTTGQNPFIIKLLPIEVETDYAWSDTVPDPVSFKLRRWKQPVSPIAGQASRVEKFFQHKMMVLADLVRDDKKTLTLVAPDLEGYVRFCTVGAGIRQGRAG